MRKLRRDELYDGIIVQCRDGTDAYPALYLLYRENGLFAYKSFGLHGMCLYDLEHLTRNVVLNSIKNQNNIGESDVPLDVWYETELTIRLNVVEDRNRKLEELGI